MAKKKYISSLKLLKLEHNAFAKSKLNQYKDWWNKYSKEFLGIEVDVKGSAYHLLQREYADMLLKDILSKNNCDKDSIPYMEITPLYREANDGLLFVNCNPSGTDYPYYRDYRACNGTSPNDFCYYYNPDNAYFKAVAEFAEKVGGEGFDNYAMIDVFPIVIQNQAV